MTFLYRVKYLYLCTVGNTGVPWEIKHVYAGIYLAGKGVRLAPREDKLRIEEKVKKRVVMLS